MHAEQGGRAGRWALELGAGQTHRHGSLGKQRRQQRTAQLHLSPPSLAHKQSQAQCWAQLMGRAARLGQHPQPGAASDKQRTQTYNRLERPCNTPVPARPWPSTAHTSAPRSTKETSLTESGKMC